MLRLLSRDHLKWLLHHHANFSSTTAANKLRLEGKVALITGGASGLGKATAQEFTNQGAQVFIADINSKLGFQAAQEIGNSAHFIHCDVTDEAQIAHAVNAAPAHQGKLDIMFNNAGIVGPQYPPTIADLDLDHFDQVMRVNVWGMLAGVKHAARVMISAKSGSILCTASISGLMGGLGSYPYSISKSTLPGIVKSAAYELGKHGIRINCISPGPIATPMVMEQLGRIYQKVGEEEIRKIVNGLGGELEGEKCEEIDVAKAALFLASDEAKYVTGHNLVVDGGFTCFKHLNLPSLG